MWIGVRVYSRINSVCIGNGWKFMSFVSLLCTIVSTPFTVVIEYILAEANVGNSERESSKQKPQQWNNNNNREFAQRFGWLKDISFWCVL